MVSDSFCEMPGPMKIGSQLPSHESGLPMMDGWMEFQEPKPPWDGVSRYDRSMTGKS